MFGALATSVFLVLPAHTPLWVPPVAALLNISGYIAYSITVVCQNAFLPSLAEEDLQSRDQEDRPLLEDKTTMSLTISRLSSICFGIGLTSSFFGLILLEILLTVLGSSVHALQIGIGLTGVWWGMFTLPAFGLPGGRAHGTVGWNNGWQRIGTLVRPSKMRGLSNLYRFLIAWFLPF